jgi:hypothetical protein
MKTNPGGPLSACPSTYNCCVQFTSQGTPACGCTNLSPADCTTFEAVLGGSKVALCPP